MNGASSGHAAQARKRYQDTTTASMFCALAAMFHRLTALSAHRTVYTRTNAAARRSAAQSSSPRQSCDVREGLPTAIALLPQTRLQSTVLARYKHDCLSHKWVTFLRTNPCYWGTREMRV